MAQTSRFFTGTTIGDATLAPYAGLGFGLQLLGNYIIPNEDVTEELLVTSTGNPGEISVAPGAAACNTVLYINDDNEVVTLDAAVNNRIDWVIVRNDATNTARITVVKGIEAAVPDPPAINATDTPLARIWLPAGFNPAADAVPDEHIYDGRIFRPSGMWNQNIESYANLMFNSEFIAYSGYAAGNLPPEGWRLVGAPTINGVAKIGAQLRGMGVQIQANAGLGMETQLRAPDSRIYTVRFTLHVAAGSVQVIVGGPAAPVTQVYYPTNSDLDYIIRCNLAETDEEIPIEITANAAASDFTISQIILSQGHVAGFYRPKSELIMLDTALTDAAWTASAKSSANTPIDMSASFGSMINDQIRGLILRVRGNDSGSAAGAPSVKIYDHEYETYNTPMIELILDGAINDALLEATGLVSLSSDAIFNIKTVATGVGTLDVSIDVLGVIT